MRFHIRPAGTADVPAIRSVVDDAYGHYVERIGRLPAPMTADYLELVTSGAVWVLTADEEVVGVAVLRHADDHLLVSNIAVARRHQGHGLGRALLDHAESHARRHGIDDLRLYTHELMYENVAIYTRLGWEVYDRAEHEGFRRVFMRKRLTGAPMPPAPPAGR